MLVTIKAVLDGKVTLDAQAQVDTFADLSKLTCRLDEKVKGVKKALPDMADKAVEKVRLVME